ncbi:AAA domain-containing protein [Nocardia sp. NPDC088792]|uniref:AAA domain-containing protein n=1 Tax=Nocardia sp. NPDC088792 TaxID=3364332 RepID=UPI003827D0EC
MRTVHVSDGRESSNKVNSVEAERIVDQIEQCLADPRYDGKTFGVISLLGPAQAKYIAQVLVSRIGPEVVVSRGIQCGDAADFQGAERDVIFLSLVATAGPHRRLVAQTADGVVQRFNVAVSRARDQLWLFHSVTLDQLTNSADLRFQLLDYCRSIELRVAAEAEPPERFPDDHVVEPFTSLFAQQVYNRIVDRGYRIVAHYTETAHPIDMVVTGHGGQVAIQCDDDHWSGPDDFRAELHWQRDLERCDWPFHRMRLAEFVADPDRCLDEVWELLEDNRIQPIGAEPEGPPGQAVSGPAEIAMDPEAHPADVDSAPESEQLSAEFADSAEIKQSDATMEAEPESSVMIGEALTPVAIGPYATFTGVLESPTIASHATIVEDFLRIVAVEGPVTGARLRAAYVTAARTRERDHVRDALDRALCTAVRSGKLLVDDALENKDRASLTYRLHGQPETLWRELGPRKVEQVPPRELAEILAHFAVDHGWDDSSRLFRTVINALGQTRLTPNTLAALESVLPLATRIGSGN